MDAGIPEYVFSMFQGKFAILTPALIAGAFAERVSFKVYLLFIALWGLFVYNPLCHWVWSEGGFLYNMGAAGAIDFAGGTVVHISAGVSGLVAALVLGFVASAFCYYAIQLKDKLGYDDSLDRSYHGERGYGMVNPN